MKKRMAPQNHPLKLVSSVFPARQGRRHAVRQRLRFSPGQRGAADLEAGSDFKEGDARCSVRVFERYSMMGGNRLSLTLTMFQNGNSPIRLSAITAGGSQAVFFKVNTLGEESFLNDVKDLL